MTRARGARLWLGAGFGLVAGALAFVVEVRGATWQGVVLVGVLAVIALALAAPGALRRIRESIAAWRGSGGGVPPAGGSGSGAA